MDEDLKDLEAELARLQPVAPSQKMRARLERELEGAASTAAPTSRRNVLPWLVALPAAAAIALLIAGQKIPLQKPAPTPNATHGSVVAAAPAPAEGLKPVAAENVLYAASDEGVIMLADGTPARRERLQFMDTITWKNPRTNASLRWTVPREEVRVVPIAFH